MHHTPRVGGVTKSAIRRASPADHEAEHCSDDDHENRRSRLSGEVDGDEGNAHGDRAEAHSDERCESAHRSGFGRSRRANCGRDADTESAEDQDEQPDAEAAGDRERLDRVERKMVPRATFDDVDGRARVIGNRESRDEDRAEQRPDEGREEQPHALTLRPEVWADKAVLLLERAELARSADPELAAVLLLLAESAARLALLASNVDEHGDVVDRWPW